MKFCIKSRQFIQLQANLSWDQGEHFCMWVTFPRNRFCLILEAAFCVVLSFLLSSFKFFLRACSLVKPDCYSSIRMLALSIHLHLSLFASAVVLNVVYMYKSCFVPGKREKHGNHLVGKGLAFYISSKVSPKLRCINV